MTCLFFFSSNAVEKARERASEKRESRRRDCKSRAGPHPAGRSDRFRLFTAAMDHICNEKLLRGDGEEAERGVGSRKDEAEPRSRLAKLPKLRLEKRRARATKPSLDGAPAPRPSRVSDLRASTQRRERGCSLPLCGELEGCAAARDVPEGRGGEGKKKDLEDF